MLQLPLFISRVIPLNKIVIFGVGLIGGSLAIAIRQAHPAVEIVGLGRDGELLHAATELGVIDRTAASIAEAMQDADLVVIATPVAQIRAILQAITPHLQAHTIVTDVGSTKSDVLAYARQALPADYRGFVAGHPIAGAEKTGVTAARDGLFHHKHVVLTPDAHTSAQALQSVQSLWESAGAKVVCMSAQQHDAIFAAVSHLPHLLAFALVNELASRDNQVELFRFAASGFRDFTRIAGSSPEMWRDITLANRSALLAELDAYQKQLRQLQTLIEHQDSAGLLAMFEHASQARNTWAESLQSQ
ncbi:prephenate dehydrogenase [Pseudomethylobacillus aquaticus]|uniref:prephenate dehydrogenase n=1 Tax=Pseudomethylobacillus aquaticus TaxID=2676064 RepID=UPI001EFF8D3C|nr:prephenate dehydrogenase/arogenate dehydrogenase family protein [Pseudomethylobacillus aquaticus]